MAPTRAQLLSIASKVIASIHSFTIEDLLSYRSPTCISQILPTTLKQSPQSNDQFAAFLSQLVPLVLTPFEVVYDEEDTVVDLEKRKVVIYVKESTNTQVGVYRNEIVITVWVDEAGESVEKWEEFMDSNAFSDFFKRLEESQRQGQSHGKEA